MTRALLIPVSGRVELANVATDLTSLQGLIGGGWLEGVTFSGTAHLYCDEEGKLKGLPINVHATELVRHFMPRFADIICGDAIVLGHNGDGEEHDVPRDVAALLVFDGDCSCSTDDRPGYCELHPHSTRGPLSRE